MGVIADDAIAPAVGGMEVSVRETVEIENKHAIAFPTAITSRPLTNLFREVKA